MDRARPSVARPVRGADRPGVAIGAAERRRSADDGGQSDGDPGRQPAPQMAPPEERHGQRRGRQRDAASRGRRSRRRGPANGPSPADARIAVRSSRDAWSRPGRSAFEPIGRAWRDGVAGRARSPPDRRRRRSSRRSADSTRPIDVDRVVRLDERQQVGRRALEDDRTGRGPVVEREAAGHAGRATSPPTRTVRPTSVREVREIRVGAAATTSGSRHVAGRRSRPASRRCRVPPAPRRWLRATPRRTARIDAQVRPAARQDREPPVRRGRVRPAHDPDDGREVPGLDGARPGCRRRTGR